MSHYWFSERAVGMPDRHPFTSRITNRSVCSEGKRLCLAVGERAVITATCQGASAPGSSEDMGDETVIGLLRVMLKNTAVMTEEAEDHPIKPAAPGAATAFLPGK